MIYSYLNNITLLQKISVLSRNERSNLLEGEGSQIVQKGKVRKFRLDKILGPGCLMHNNKYLAVKEKARICFNMSQKIILSISFDEVPSCRHHSKVDILTQFIQLLPKRFDRANLSLEFLSSREKADPSTFAPLLTARRPDIVLAKVLLMQDSPFGVELGMVLSEFLLKRVKELALWQTKLTVPDGSFGLDNRKISVKSLTLLKSVTLDVSNCRSKFIVPESLMFDWQINQRQFPVEILDFSEVKHVESSLPPHGLKNEVFVSILQNSE